VEKFSQVREIGATAFHGFCFLACSILLLFLPVSAQELPAGTALEARLSGATGSRISHRGDPTEATIIAPVSVHGRILVPQGSRLVGSIANTTAIGFGLKHSTASIAYAFHTLQLPGGAAIPVHSQLVEVETAKEHVDDLGTVHGIHPIASLSSSLSFYVVPLLLVNPTIGAPVWCIKSLIAPSANPEIHFPTGTELILRLTTSVTVPAPKMDSVPTKPFSRGDLAEIEHLLKNSAQRAYMGNRPSDVVNVLLIGSRKQMDRAFHASGWSQAHRKSPVSLFRMYDALTKRNGYPSAPMNSLTLNGVRSAFVHQKSLDTVQKRHHVRVWQYPRRADIWLGAAAEDVGFRFELAHWTHSTDSHIDSERAKVVNDLAFTGCVDAAGLLPRAPTDLAQNPKEEHPIVTDEDVAAVRLNDCIHPNLMAGERNTSGLRERGRLARVLTAFRDDVVRSNILFTTYNTLTSLAKRKPEPTTTHVPLIHGEPRGLDCLTPPTPLQSGPGQ
jgi:LssY C-terminus